MLIKKDSSRLKNKNWRCYKGKPMFQWNLEKLLLVFDEVYVSCSNEAILHQAQKLGALGIVRPEELNEATNIDCYRHAQKFMKSDCFVAVQANSPECGVKLIKYAKELLELGHEEVKSCHYDGKDYGSIWGMTSERLAEYEDPHNARPSKWIKDFSKDIHNADDLWTSFNAYRDYKMKFKGK